PPPAPPPPPPQHLTLDAWVLIQHPAETPARQREQAHRRLGRHGRVTRHLRDHGDLTHEVAAAQRRHPPALAGDLHLPVDDHKELVPELALLAEYLARLDLEVFADPCQLDEFLAGQALEQGRALERLHLGVLGEQPHGAYRIRVRSLRRAAEDRHSPGLLSGRMLRSSKVDAGAGETGFSAVQAFARL